MKKIFLSLLLLLSFVSFGQAEFNEGVQITGGQTTTASTNKIISQEANGVLNYIPALSLPISTATTLELRGKQFLSTGLLKNGLITINGDPTKFNVMAGIGVISNFDNPEAPVSNIINFGAFTGITPTYLTTGNITYLAVNSSGVLVQQATEFTTSQRRDLILLGAVIHSNLTTINVINNISAPSNADTNQLHDLMTYVGALNLDGNKYTANGANLALNKSSGTIFKLGVNFATDWKKPHELGQALQTALTFRYRTQNGTEGTDRINLNPALYDLNNVLTTVPNNKFTIQAVTLFQTGLTRIQYGQNVYDDLASAERAIFTRDFVVENNIKMNGISRAYIIMRNSTTSLQNTADAKIVEVQKFGGVASGGVALTLANIVDALGYTPENEANKATDFSVVNNTLYPSVQAVNKRVKFVTPEQFGAIGNGIADDKTAIQNAINSLKPVFFSGSYYVSGTITISNESELLGGGKLITTSNLPILDIKSSNVVINGLYFEGNGRGTITDYTTTRPLQIGVNIEGVLSSIVYKNIKINNCNFYNLGGSAIKIYNNLDDTRSGGGLISNCVAEMCYKGYFLDDRGEYNNLSNIKAFGCEFGAYILGGNNSFSGSSLDANRTGLYLGSGLNPAHSTFSGGSINHSIDKSIYSQNNNLGYNFLGVQILYGIINIENSEDVKFNSCDIRSENVSITTSTNTTFKNCTFHLTPTTFVGMSLCVFSSTKWITTPFIGFKDSNEQPMSINDRLDLLLGSVGSYIDLAQQSINSISLGNGSSSGFSPIISGKTNGNTGLFLTSMTSETNPSADMTFSVRESDNTDFSTLTNPAFRFFRFGTSLITVLRNGNTAFTGTIASPTFTGGAVLTGTPTAPTATAGTNTTQIATTAFVETAASGNVKLTGDQTIAGTKTFNVMRPSSGVIFPHLVDGGFFVGGAGNTGIAFDANSLNIGVSGAPTLSIDFSSVSGVTKTFTLPNQTGTFALTVNPTPITATQYNISALNTAPASATATGTLGETRVTSTHIYVCTATNTWVRTALSTW